MGFVITTNNLFAAVSTMAFVISFILSGQSNFLAVEAQTQTQRPGVDNAFIGLDKMMMIGPRTIVMNNMSNMNNTNITGSISLFDTITTAVESKINVSFSDAAVSAETSLGNNSHAVAGHLGDENGYLVYNILVLGPDKNFNRILVDPGNGNIILTEKISKENIISQGRPMHSMALPAEPPMMPKSMAPGIMMTEPMMRP
jgi:hypothetical protein